jgi:hypothetical protein
MPDATPPRIRVLTPEERAAQLAEDERGFRRRRVVRALWRALGFFGSCALGLVFVAFAFRTSDPEWGQIFLLTGVLVGNVGIMLTLFLAWRRAQRDGDL